MKLSFIQHHWLSNQIVWLTSIAILSAVGIRVVAQTTTDVSLEVVGNYTADAYLTTGSLISSGGVTYSSNNPLPITVTATTTSVYTFSGDVVSTSGTGFGNYSLNELVVLSGGDGLKTINVSFLRSGREYIGIDPISVFLDQTGPTTPVVTGPTSGEVVSGTIVFSRTTSTDTGVGFSGYEIDIATDNTFGTILFSGTTTSTSLILASGSLATGSYVWRLRPIDLLGNKSPYTENTLNINDAPTGGTGGSGGGSEEETETPKKGGRAGGKRRIEDVEEFIHGGTIINTHQSAGGTIEDRIFNRYDNYEIIRRQSYCIRRPDVNFLDIDDEPYEDAITILANNCIVIGRERDRYAPQAAITRSEITTITVKVLYINNQAGRTPGSIDFIGYADVANNNRSFDFIAALDDLGLSDVISIDTETQRIFDPEGFISRQKAAILLAHAAQMDNKSVPSDIRTAISDARSQELLTRNDAADWYVRTFELVDMSPFDRQHRYFWFKVYEISLVLEPERKQRFLDALYERMQQLSEEQLAVYKLDKALLLDELALVL